MTDSDQRSERPKASTRDVLLQTPNGRVHSKWRKHQQRLVNLRESLQGRQTRLVEAVREEQPVFSLHIGDAGTDQYNQDFALSMLSSDQSAIYEIEEALNRICNGTYGICELTGQTIEPERLEAIPWARFTLQAQRNFENEGGGLRAHFAPRAALVGGGSEEEEPANAEDSE